MQAMHFTICGGFLCLAGALAPRQGAHAPVVQAGADGTGIERVPVLEAWPAPAALVAAEIDLAICLDTSGSMSGLIEATKQKLWAIVNDLALVTPMPRLRVALLTFGNNGHAPESGWVRIDAPLTEDLDLISERLFALSTNGGEEYVGRVVHTAASDLAWSATPGALKLIVVAGNESADQDPLVRTAAACATAIGRDILVNAIYCGNPADEIAPGWREVAKLADGQFASIDHEAGTVTIVTPFDAELAELSTAVNSTYVPFGAGGTLAWENQSRQDANAVGLNSEAAASRAELKARAFYVCDWDLVTAAKEGRVKLAELPVEQLPETMRVMTLEQQLSFLDENAAKRQEIEQKIGALAAQRALFVEAELAKQAGAGSRSFDAALRTAIRAQVEQRGFRFAPPPTPAVPPAEGAAPPAQVELPAQIKANPPTQQLQQEQPPPPSAGGALP